MRALRGVACACVLAACSYTQSFEEGMRMVCDAPGHVTETDRALRPAALNAYIMPKVRNRDIKALFIRAATLTPAEAKTAFVAAAMQAGITDCGIVDEFKLKATAPSP